MKATACPMMRFATAVPRLGAGPTGPDGHECCLKSHCVCYNLLCLYNETKDIIKCNHENPCERTEGACLPRRAATRAQEPPAARQLEQETAAHPRVRAARGDHGRRHGRSPTPPRAPEGPEAWQAPPCRKRPAAPAPARTADPPAEGSVDRRVTLYHTIYA